VYVQVLVVERFIADNQQHRPSVETFFDVESGRFGHMPMLAHGVQRIGAAYISLQVDGIGELAVVTRVVSQNAAAGGDVVFPYALDASGTPISSMSDVGTPLQDACNKVDTKVRRRRTVMTCCAPTERLAKQADKVDCAYVSRYACAVDR
jgi:hypothetical protein